MVSGWDQEYDIQNHARDFAQQLHREHLEGIAAERLERERRALTWDIEGWTGDDELVVHVAGMGTLRLPADEVVRLANAMLTEHELRFRGETDINGWLSHE